MDAILLAGGYGTRLRPLTYTRPKPLLPVAGRAMMDWVLDRLPPEVRRVLVTVNWKADALAKHLEEQRGDLETLVVPETSPLGTAGAVRNCEAHLGSDRFFVLNADIVSRMDLGAMLRLHRKVDAVGTIALREVAPSQLRDFGVAALAPGDPTRLVGFVEKPQRPEDAPSRLINAGAYLLERQVLDLIPRGRLVSMEKEIFPQLLARGLHGFVFQGLWIDVGDPARLLEASRRLDPVHWHGADARVAPDASVQGCVAGDRLRVGAGAHLERCVLGSGVEVRAGARLVDCVVGDGETVAGTHVGERIWSRAVPPGYPTKQVGNVLGG